MIVYLILAYLVNFNSKNLDIIIDNCYCDLLNAINQDIDDIEWITL